MTNHRTHQKGAMGVAILAVLGLFLALHLIVPTVTLWPAGLVTLAVTMMVVSHVTKSGRRDRRADHERVVVGDR